MSNYQDIREDVVVVEEKMKLKPQFFIKGVKGGSGLCFKTPPGGFSLKIQRNLRDDTFNMVFKDVYVNNNNFFASEKNSFIPFINIDGVDTPILGGHVNVDDKNLNSFFIHRSMTDNAIFRETKSISVGIKRRKNDTSYRMSIYPQFETLKDNVRIGENKILDFKSINAISISTKRTDDFGTKVHLNDDQLDIKKSYSHTLLVPRKLERMGKNITVFDAFIYNEIIDGVNMPGIRDTEADVSFHEGKIKTTSFKKSLNLVVNDIQGEKMREYKNETKEILKKLVGQREHGNGSHSLIKYIGSFNMFDQTSYDYEKGISVVGSSSTSREGEIIPYSLKGGYFRESTLGVNEIYKKIKILQTFTNQKPILQPDAGKVMLDIKSFSEPNNDFIEYDIDPKILIKQKDYIFPLDGLKRIATEHRTKND